MRIRVQAPDSVFTGQAAKPPSEPPIVTRESLDGQVGIINRWNIKTMSDGKQYVIHCVTGDVLSREVAIPVQDRRGNVMWIRKAESLSPLDRPILQQWKNPEKPSI